MSGVHAEIFRENGCFLVIDLGSTNMTWMRLSPEGVMSGMFPLVLEDRLKIGSTVFYVKSLCVSPRQSTSTFTY